MHRRTTTLRHNNITGESFWGKFLGKVLNPETNCMFSTLPKEFGPRWAELEDPANQTLSLIKRWGGTGEVEFTV